MSNTKQDEDVLLNFANTVAIIEEYSEKIHHNYCEYVLARTGKLYWTEGDYSKLDEATKAADRIQARWIVKVVHDAVMAEREACAKIAESMNYTPNSGFGRGAKDIAKAIREGGQ